MAEAIGTMGRHRGRAVNARERQPTQHGGQAVNEIWTLRLTTRTPGAATYELRGFGLSCLGTAALAYASGASAAAFWPAMRPNTM